MLNGYRVLVSLFALASVGCFSYSVHAAIFLGTEATLLPGGNLISYTVAARSTAGELVNGVIGPSVTAAPGSLGAHQVWTAAVSLPTPTRQSQLDAGPLWSDSWLPYDSYFFNTTANSLAGGPAFTESKSGAGAVLPAASFGAPSTGFGTIGGSPASSFIFLPPYAGTNVPFAQLVARPQDTLLLNVTVSAEAASQIFNFVISSGLGDGPPIATRNKITAVPGANVQSLFEAILVSPASPIWGELSSFTGPGAAIQPQFNPATQQFTWDSTGSALGTYIATVPVRHGLGPAQTTNATLTITLVPEPATSVLLGIALLSAYSCTRRR